MHRAKRTDVIEPPRRQESPKILSVFLASWRFNPAGIDGRPPNLPLILDLPDRFG